MKFPLFKVLKVYFALLAALVVLGLIALVVLVVHKNRNQERLAQHPYVQARLHEGYQIVKECGTYKRKWGYELTVLCLEKTAADSSAIRLTSKREAFLHETGTSACAYRVVRPADSACVPAP
jgi:hypothetical protein